MSTMRQKIYSADYYSARRVEKLAWQRAYRKRNLVARRNYNQRYEKIHADKIAATKAFIKEAAINMYSNGEAVCKWCGQGDIDLLCLDHIYNDGDVHRKTFKGPSHRWAMRHDYPPIFQVLCHNCNAKKECLRKRGLPTTREEALK
jgi:hypothetical protein